MTIPFLTFLSTISYLLTYVCYSFSEENFMEASNLHTHTHYCDKVFIFSHNFLPTRCVANGKVFIAAGEVEK